jgi:outer membrane usher protein
VNRNLRSVFVNLTLALDARTSVSTGLQHDNSSNFVTASTSRATPTEGGWGWNAALRQGDDQNGGQGELDYLGRYGRYAAGVSAFNGTRYAYGDANGALVFMGGHPFAARQINDAFALVSTEGVPNVPVMLENRPIGRTDRNGQLLVTPLNAYQNNQLAIDPMQLPADMRIARVRAIATPSDRAGTLVNFDITPVRAASIVLVDAAGKPLPLGSLVRVNAQPGKPTLVGYDGEVYLDTLDTRNVLTVQTPAGACTVRFDYHKDTGGSIPQIGPLRCTKEASP